ncbi:MAG: hypothetical protein ABIH76_05155 [Candidatus Bathyarchaeota archaeon]
MSIDVVDARYGKVKKTLPDLILIILAREYPLTVAQITKVVKKEFGIKVTYQAVRKSLFTLEDRRILDRDSGVFSVKKEYILGQKRLLDQMLGNYFTAENMGKLPLYSKGNEPYTTYNFETLLQTDKFWGEMVLDWAYNLKEGDDRRFVFHGPHCWYVFGHLGTEYDFLNLLKAHGVTSYYLVESKTTLDEWTKQFYKDNGVMYKINKKAKEPMRTAVGIFGEYIMQFSYPDELFDKIEKFYSSTRSIRSLDMTKIAETLKKKTSIEFIVNRNKIIADKLKEEIVSKF